MGNRPQPAINARVASSGCHGVDDPYSQRRLLLSALAIQNTRCILSTQNARLRCTDGKLRACRTNRASLGLVSARAEHSNRRCDAATLTSYAVVARLRWWGILRPHLLIDACVALSGCHGVDDDPYSQRRFLRPALAKTNTGCILSGQNARLFCLDDEFQAVRAERTESCLDSFLLVQKTSTGAVILSQLHPMAMVARPRRWGILIPLLAIDARVPSSGCHKQS